MLGAFGDFLKNFDPERISHSSKTIPKPAMKEHVLTARSRDIHLNNSREA